MKHGIPERPWTEEEEAVIEKRLIGVIRSEAESRRKGARRAEEIISLLDKQSGLRHEIRRLEDLLAWVHRTKQPIEEIRRVIEENVPRRINRGA